MNDSETLDGVTDMGDDPASSGPGPNPDPETIADSMGASGDDGDGWAAGDDGVDELADSGGSPFDALRATEPHEDLDDVSRLKLSPDYANAYATRGVNKTVGASETEAWMDFLLAGVCYAMLLMDADTTDSDDTDGADGAHPDLDGPDVVGP